MWESPVHPMHASSRKRRVGRVFKLPSRAQTRRRTPATGWTRPSAGSRCTTALTCLPPPPPDGGGAAPATWIPHQVSDQTARDPKRAIARRPAPHEPRDSRNGSIMHFCLGRSRRLGAPRGAPTTQEAHRRPDFVCADPPSEAGGAGAAGGPRVHERARPGQRRRTRGDVAA